MIAVCPNCKLIFEGQGIIIQDSTNVTISNAKVTCPNCRSMAKYLDGTFNFDSNGIISVLSAPQFTIDILNQIKSLAEDVQNQKITPEEFHKEVDAMPSIIRSIIKLVVPNDPSSFWKMIGVLLIVLNHLTGVDADKEIDQSPLMTKPQTEVISQTPHDAILPKKDTLPPIDDTTLHGNN